MKKDLDIKVAISIILWVIAAFLIIRGIFGPVRLKRADLSQKGGVRVGEPGPAEGTKHYIHPRKSRKSTVNVWGGSPFLPLKTEDARVMTESGSIALEGVMWDEKTPRAIINGRVMKVKDRIGANEVVEIKQDRVILNDGKNLIELNIVGLKKNE